MQGDRVCRDVVVQRARCGGLGARSQVRDADADADWTSTPNNRAARALPPARHDAPPRQRGTTPPSARDVGADVSGEPVGGD